MTDTISISVYVESEGDPVNNVEVTIKWDPISIIPGADFYSEYTDSSGHADFAIEVPDYGEDGSVTIWVLGHEEGPYSAKDGDSFTIDISDC